MSHLTVGLINSLPSAVVALDNSGRITALNSAAEQLLSTTAERAAGELYPSIFGPSLAAKMLTLFHRTARTGASSSPSQLAATLPDGRRVTLRASLGQTFDTDGSTIGMLFVADEAPAAAEASPPPTPDLSSERYRQALKRYLGDVVGDMVMERPSFLDVGGKNQEVSILHTDVRGYTAVAERLPPDELLTVLSRYHGAAAAAIQTHGGTMDRFLGDAVLALWNAPAPQEDHARQAIRGALALRDATVGIGTELSYGVGVHTGVAMVGNLGSGQYMNFTAIGDSVNVAARLQAAAGGGEVVCSAVALAAAGPGVQVTPLGEIELKGRSMKVEAYRVESIDG